jgi:phosphoglycolate phosphatase
MASTPDSVRYGAVLFDLDGTLLDTVPDIACAANRMLAELGRPVLPDALIATFVGRGIPKLVERVLFASLDGHVPADALERGLEIFERCYAEESGLRSAFYPGVLTGLDRLAGAGVPMGVVTNKAARFTHDLLGRADLSRYFSVVVSGDTLPVKKPDPAPVLHACAQLGVAPEAALFIGDSRHDVAAGHAAGCAVWCVPYGYNEGAPVESLQCDRIVCDLGVAAGWILGELSTVGPGGD